MTFSAFTCCAVTTSIQFQNISIPPKHNSTAVKQFLPFPIYPQPLATTNVHLSLWIYLFWIFHMNRATHRVVRLVPGFFDLTHSSQSSSMLWHVSAPHSFLLLILRFMPMLHFFLISYVYNACINR